MMRLACECGRTLGYEPRHAGKTVRCPGCDRLLVVPHDSDLSEPPPEVADEEPRRRKRRAAGEPVPMGWMHTVGAVLYSGPAAAAVAAVAVVGIGLGVYGFSEGKVAAGATQRAQTISCEKLIAGGIPANPHVIVTDVYPGGNFIYTMKVTKTEQDSGNTAGKPWESVYVPLLPLTPEVKTRLARGEPIDPKPPGGAVRLLLLSFRAKNENDLGNSFSPTGTVQGMIVNSVRTLDAATETRFRQAYPGIDTARVLILEDGRKPTSPAFTLGMMIGGALLVVAALALGTVALVFRPRH